MTVQEIADLVGVPRSTVYAHLNRRDYALVIYRSDRQHIDDRGRPYGETLHPAAQLEADAKWWRITASKRPRLRAMVFVVNGVVARIRPVLRGEAWVTQPDDSGRVRAPLGPELVTEDDFAAADLSTLTIRPGDPRPTVQGRQRESVAL
jgi:AcrR family transcriptional regulator